MKSVLDDIFGTAEEDVKTFSDILRDEEALESLSETAAGQDLKDVLTGKPRPAIDDHSFKMQQSGFIGIEHGYHSDDYVWHLQPLRANKSWKVSLNRVAYAIAKTLNTVIPNSTEVKIFYPKSDWDIQAFTFKAVGLKNVWSVSHRELDAVTLELFKVLNTLV